MASLPDASPSQWPVPVDSCRAAVGLIAGAGQFPIHFAKKARAAGLDVVCVGVAGMADPALQTFCTHFVWLRRMSLGLIFRTFHRGGVDRWTMAGKFHKHILFRPWVWLRLLPDWRAAKFWLSRRQRQDNKDDSILLNLIDEFQSEGLRCVSALELCPELLVKPGNLTRNEPTIAEQEDIQFGWNLAKEMGRLDIGQSVMIRKRACLAVEAIEGTDEAILRAGLLCGRNRFVVVKVAKPQQDMRFDVPTIGRQTLETMKQAGANVLAIEADKTIILEEQETLALANRYGMCIVALSGSNLEV